MDFQYLWDFGDGAQISGASGVHTYNAAGDYAVSLTLSSDSDTRTEVRDVSVIPSLRTLKTINLHVESPSGLSFGLDPATLWTVSDKPAGRVVEILGEACQDSMSGEEFETTVTVEYQGKTYRGCGRALH